MNADEMLVELATARDFVEREVTSNAETLTLEQLVDVETSLGLLAKAVADAKSLVTTAQCNALEQGGRQVGTKFYQRVKKWKHTYDHRFVKHAIRDEAKAFATDKASGEVDLRAAVDKAVELAFDMYCSASTKPKVGKLKALNIEPSDVDTKEHIGWEVDVVDLAKDSDDGDE